VQRSLSARVAGAGYVFAHDGTQPFSGAVGYIASKAAVIAFAQAVAVEYREEAIRCNAVLPSVIDTPANRRAQPEADHARWVSPDPSQKGQKEHARASPG
jgi:NAD(P)-dependent dehydrogenase (short-subunit alcohol dehydrogenase family)